MQKGLFLTFEGPDGSGKSSVIKELVPMIEARDPRPLVVSREPGGGQISEEIRSIILNENFTHMDSRTEALLFAASRRQHIKDIIEPALAAGKIVISDRFVDSSLVYQGVARNIPVDQIWQINQFAIEDRLPDLTFLLDVPAELGLERIHAARGQRQFDRLDQEDLAFHNRVRQAYLDLAQGQDRFQLIDGRQSIGAVAQACLEILVDEALID